MRERAIERRLIQAVRQCGGLALKFVSPGFNGVPDRLLLFMGGKVAFVEVKAPGEGPRPLQVHRMEQLRRMGFKVFVLDSVNQIEGIISSVIPTDPHVIPAEVEGSPPRVIPRFETPGERASGSFSAENGRQPRGKALQAIDFLSQAYMLDQQIQTKMHQLSSLRSLSESMHSFRASEPVSHTKNVTMLEDAVIKIMEEEQELNAEIDRLVDLKREIEDERIKPFLRLIEEGLSYSDVMILLKWYKVLPR